MGVLRYFRRAKWDRERLKELESYVQFETDTNIARGMSPEDAGEAAHRKLGNRTLIREEIYRMNSVGIFDILARDLRYAIRSLAHNPTFTAIAVITLALGIGANTALFSVVNAVLIEPLPYPQADRLVRLWTSTKRAPRGSTSLPDYREWRQRNRTFEEMGAYSFASFNFTGAERPERLQGTRVTSSVWSVLRVQPLLGRVFDSSDEEWGRHRVVLLSEGFWRRRFAADNGILGQQLRLNGELYSVIGVMPAASQFPGPLTEVWAPMAFPPGDNLNTRNNSFSDVIGRMKPGVSFPQAEKDLASVAESLGQELRGYAEVGIALLGLQETYVGVIRPTLQLLFGAAGVVLLIACGNAANLLLARATGRKRELTVRMALGAGKSRLVRQLLTESFVLAGAGVALGVGLGYAFMRLLLYFAPPGMPRFQEVSLDGKVLAFTVALGFLTALLFGLWPAWNAARGVVNEGLKESGRSSGAARSGGRVRKVLVVAQVALSLVLLIGASLLISSLLRVQGVEPGFAPDHLLTMQVNLPPVRYAQAKAADFAESAAKELASVPGIRSAAATTAIPLGQGGWNKILTIEGAPVPAAIAQQPFASYFEVTPDYFSSMRVTLRRGEIFSGRERDSDPLVAVVNETLARRFWPDGNPLGKRIVMLPAKSLIPPNVPLPKDYDSYWLTIVGVVADLRTFGLETQPNPEVYVPLAQHHDETQNFFFLIARTEGDPLAPAKAVEAAVHKLDANLPVTGMQSMETRLAASFARRQYSLFQLGLFAGLALALAMIGLYGVIAYAVSQRSQEMGIRAALGARAGDLVRLVTGQGLVLTGIGIVVGLGGAAALSRIITGLLFEVKPIDPLLYGVAAVLLFGLAALACWIPGRRAARTDPAITLRYD
jgi:predicted permease